MTSQSPGDQEPKSSTASFSMPDNSDGFQLAEAIGWFLLEKNASEVVVLDLRGFSDVCDFFVIAEGTSDIQVRALAKHVQDRVLALGQKARNLEGFAKGRWVLLDFFDVVVHVFQEEPRNFYQLERLWNDAGRLDLAPDWFRDPQAVERHPELKFSFAPGAETQGPKSHD